ncbi:SusC/RagA family TonB-linked outer membrane protein [Salegentibacter salinarum]|uniref:SusC/RagA family TonB-linked outer membrane protein n=1 Tax=Salegentibacter salinarum TaxID=447422 RepID=A0A2N0TSI9_9FLAO|nr:TonB-dependent receptor [Salegentibacter salinarum]PKD17709.1 SusC/RagA family TonB-linked outer membrane protein [Salegentibacter salinarum]SKB51280.1 TonB-linked outer membrane protein, SusC/RagA family [Salegentibacter salinarum]
MKHLVRKLLMYTGCILFSIPVFAQEKEVTGTVTDENGIPVPGVNVAIEGTTSGTQTNFDGVYELNASEGDVLVFSFIGMQQTEVTIGDATEYNIVMEEGSSELDEVVVVGYGTRKKSDVTGAVANVSSEELMTQPVSNAFQALQGKAAGVDITSSERPGTIGTVRIRGNRSLTASNAPLYVVDGIPLLSASSIETINPRDIESIDVLKDASATAVYGSRGANGVIIVTTKKGKAGRLTLNYSGTVTASEIVDRAPSMNAADFIEFRRSAAYNLDPETYANPNSPTLENDTNIFDSPLDGQTSRDNVLQGWEGGTWDPSRVTNTDWTDFVTQTGILNEHTISASGGTEKMKAYASLGYLNDKGTQKGQFYERYSANVSTNIKPVDWFTLDANFNMSWSEQDYGFSTLGGRSSSGPNAIYGAAKNIYNMAVPYDSDGNLVINPGGESTIYTIMDEWDKSTQLSETMRALGSVSATFDIGEIIDPLEGLNYQVRFGPDFRYWREGVYLDNTSAHRINSDGSPGTNFARLNNRRDLSWTLDNIITYNKTIADKHNFDVTLLQTASSWNIENSGMNANNIPKESMLWYNFGEVDITNSENSADMWSGLNERQLSSYMARLNYGFDDRYLLTVSGRWDGASQLGEGRKWDFFPSAALAWKIDQEDFLKNSEQINSLKLRLGVGTTGNSAVDPYATKGDITSIFIPFNGMSNRIGYTTNEPYYSANQLSLANPLLGWEKTTQYNLGVDFGFFNNRVNGSFNAYRSFTSDLLMSVNIPTLTGFPSTVANIGQTNNRGVELSLNVVPIETEEFFWESNINAAWQKDEIDELAYGENDMVDNEWFIGESIGVIYGFDNEGVWQDTPEDQAEMDLWNANGYNFTPGNVRPMDQNGDYDMTQEDRIILGNRNPRWTLGWNNSIGYKGFELQALIISRLDYTASIGGQTMTARANQIDVDYWTPDNQDSEFQKPILGQATSGSQDQFSGLLGIRDAGFVKIRNISLGYNFSSEFTSRIGLSNLKIYAQAVNPGSIYQAVDWYDFDVNSMIFNRSFSLGLDIGI